jgi:glycosyltransferase involved in cell wall biosynthesis
MERQLIERADRWIAVSESLQTRLAAGNRNVALIPHGVDLAHFSKTESATPLAAAVECASPRIVFWGLVDRRMDTEFVARLARELTSGTILLVGPQDNPDPGLLALPRVRHLPAIDYCDLPALAAAAEVLIMPYADLPVTRAFNPLKLAEYLATGKPVVARSLPAVTPWVDCLYAVDTPAEFAAAVLESLQSGVTESQHSARLRLRNESWRAKAAMFEDAALSIAATESA